MISEPKDPAQIPAGPERIGEYRIEGELGKGGMGIVYKAYQSKLDRYVALKVLPPSRNISAEAVEKFIQEARASANLHHPNIAPIYDVGADGDIHYFAMEYVDGQKFDEIIKDTRVPLNAKLQVLRQVARALQYAHDHGLVHRDVKPGNIMIDKQRRVLLMDFGLARPEQAIGKPEEDSEIGTPGYMAPEQAMGKTVDRRSDIFSLGAIMYDVLAVHKSPARIDHGNPTPIEAVALMAMQHDPARRYQSADELRADIFRYLRDEPVLAKPAPLAARIIKKIKKHKALFISISVTVLLAGAFGAYFISQQLIERTRWRLVFEDDFERTELGPDWYPYDKIYISRNDTAVARRIWTIRNGELVCNHPSHTFIRICRNLAGDLRMEFDAVMADSSTDGIHCFLMADTVEREIIRGRGYAYAFGAHGNTITYLSRLDQKLGRSEEHVPAMGVRYRITAERRGSRIRLAVNGTTVLEAEDDFPVTSRAHIMAGLYSWSGTTRYDNIRIYRTTLPLKASPMAFADDLVSRGKYEEAVSYYQDILGSYSEKKTPPEVFYKTGMAYLLMQRYDLARVHFDKAITWGENGRFACRGYIGKGHAYLAEGNGRMASSVFNETVTRFENDPQISQIALLYRQMAGQAEAEDAKRALDYLEAGKKYCVGPTGKEMLAEINSETAMLYHRLGQSKKALSFLEDLLKQRPDRPELLIKIAELHGSIRGDWKKQISFLGRALRHARGSHMIYGLYRDRARARLRDGDFPAALEDADKAIALRRQNAWAYKIRADIRKAQGNTAGARADLDTALANASAAIIQSPDNAGLIRSRGMLYQEAGLHNLAIQDFTVILNRRPNYMWTRENRAVSRLALGKKREAMDDLAKILTWVRESIRQDENVWTQLLLARTLHLSGSSAEARRAARRAKELGRNNYEALKAADELLIKIGQVKK